MITEIREHLIHKIIPFWLSLRDDENGGFYGYVDHGLNVDRTAFKGCILNNRITWFFSAAAKLFMDERAGKVRIQNGSAPVSEEFIDELLNNAKHGFEFLKSACLDPVFGGMFWSVSYDGKPYDTTKHTYNQAFSIYALASYYDVTRDEDALKLALDLYRVIESRCRDDGGYLEAFDRTFTPSSNEKLSENGVLATRTMNTLLHVFEAYTELIRVLSDIEISDVFGSAAETVLEDPARRALISEIRERIDEILSIFTEKMYNPEKHRQEVFFDHEYRPLIDLISYGHDIETSWLMDRGTEVLRIVDLRMGIDPASDGKLFARIGDIAGDLADNIYRTAFDGHSLPEECEAGAVKTSRTWWMQAETLVGFLNGFQRDPSRKEYLDAVHSVWSYICEYLVDPREGSEWFHDLYEDGRPFEHQPIVEQWKCPYHNGRMCIEVIRRGVS